MSEDPEITWPGSGGGFSRHFTRPDYQVRVVDTYLGHLKNEHVGRYKCVLCRDLTGYIHTLCLRSPAGRGVPDIAAQAARFRYVWKNGTYATSGTSCSTPVRLFIL